VGQWIRITEKYAAVFWKRNKPFSRRDCGWLLQRFSQEDPPNYW